MPQHIATASPFVRVSLYVITPVPKPRMTKADRWKKRPPVVRYWEYKDLLREAGLESLPFDYWIRFTLPMPKSWSKRKRDQYRDTYHKQKPDKDNLEKGILDALYSEDCQIATGKVSKVWGDVGKIEIFAPVFTV